MVIEGCLESSIRYKVFIEGRAMKISMVPGRIVQIDSISCPSAMNLLNFFPFIRDSIEYRVMIVISDRIIIAWSWKNIRCSMIGEEVS